MQIIGDLIFSSLAQAIFAVIVEDIHNISGTRSFLLRLKEEPQVTELRIAIHEAYKEFAKEYPDWAESLFDELFLIRPAVTFELAKLLTPLEPDLSIIEKEYHQYFPTLNLDISKPLHSFISKLENQIKLRPALQNFVQNRNIELIRINTDQHIELLTEILSVLRQQLSPANPIYTDTFVDAIVTDNPDDIIERPARYIERPQLTSTIETAVRQHKRVLLQGFPGNGKTAIASEIASSYCEKGKSYIFWIHLGTESADLALNIMFRALTAEPIIASKHDRSRRIRELLRMRKIKLVVLDDIWDGTILKNILEVIPNELPLLGTSRNRYPILHRIPIQGLERHESLKLLTHYSSKQIEDDQAANELCALLSDNPFALRIAGMTISPEVDDLQPSDLLNQIKKAPHNLRLDFDDEDRQSIASLIDFSLKSLDKYAKDVFLAFGAFYSRSVSSELIAVYMQHLRRNSQKHEQVDEILTHIARYGLLDRVEANHKDIKIFSVHGLAHSYAKSFLATKHFEIMMNSCLKFSMTHGKPNHVDLSLIKLEFANLIGAVEWAIKEKRIDDVDQFLDILYGDGYTRHATVASDLVEAKNVMESAIILATNLNKPILVAKYKVHAAGMYIYLNDDEKVINYYQEALEITRQRNMMGAQATILTNLGLHHQKMHDLNTALSLFLQAKSLYSAEDRPNELFSAQIETLIADILSEFGDHKTAIKIITSLLHENINEVTQAFILGYLGSAYRKSGDIKKAIKAQTQCLGLQKKFGDHRGMAHTYRNLGNCYNDIDNHEQALTAYQKSLAINESEDDHIGIGSVLDAIGDLYVDMGKSDAAISSYKKALASFERVASGESEFWRNTISEKLPLVKNGRLAVGRKLAKASKRKIL